MPVSIASRKRLNVAAFAGRKRNPESKRQAVLQTALDMFIERGYRQTSLDEVAARLKITKPALYHYFRGKESIYLECYRRGVAQAQDNLEKVRLDGGTGLEKVVRFIQTYTCIIANDFGRFLVRQDTHELSRRAQMEVRAEKRKIDESLRVFIEQGVNDGSVRPCNVKLAAFAVAGAIQSLASWFEPGGELTAAEVAGEFAETLTQGLAKEKNRP